VAEIEEEVLFDLLDLLEVVADVIVVDCLELADQVIEVVFAPVILLVEVEGMTNLDLLKAVVIDQPSGVVASVALKYLNLPQKFRMAAVQSQVRSVFQGVHFDIVLVHFETVVLNQFV